MVNSFNFTDQKNRKDIQVFRGLAVLAVVLYHISESLFPLGYLGVDVFFTISGFVITPLIMRIFIAEVTPSWSGTFSNLNYFYKRRFYRLAPALTATLLFSALAVFIAGPISDHQKFARQGIATTLLVGNLGAYRYTGNYFSPNPNPLLHTWSLSVEEQIYIFLPLTLILILWKRTTIKKTTSVVLTIFTLVSFILFLFPEMLYHVYDYFGAHSATEFSFYLPTTRIWQFTLGGLGFLLLDNHPTSIRKFSGKIHVVLLILIILILFGSFTIDNRVSPILASFISISLILFKSLEILPNFLSKVFEWIGDRSYSIYLVHLPLIYVINYSPVIRVINVDNYLKFIVLFTLILLLGSLQYSKIESRFRRSFIINQKISIFKPLLITVIIPIVIFLSIDRIASSDIRVDQNLPVGSKVLPWAWDKNCQFLSNPDSIVSEPCVYGNSKTNKSILLIGDSHAATISRAVVTLAKNNDMKTFVFTFQGCGFVLNNQNVKPNYNYPFLEQSCLDHNKTIINFVKSKNPTVIILAHHSSSIMVEPNNLSSRKQYNDKVFKSLLELKKLNNNIIVVGSVPEYIDQNSWIQKIFGVKKSIYSNIPFEDNIYWSESTQNNLYYLDTLKMFCPKNVCKNMSDKGWLFQDRDHLSEIGANLLIPPLDMLVKNIMLQAY